MGMCVLGIAAKSYVPPPECTEAANRAVFLARILEDSDGREARNAAVELRQVSSAIRLLMEHWTVERRVLQDFLDETSRKLSTEYAAEVADVWGAELRGLLQPDAGKKLEVHMVLLRLLDRQLQDKAALTAAASAAEMLLLLEEEAALRTANDSPKKSSPDRAAGHRASSAASRPKHNQDRSLAEAEAEVASLKKQLAAMQRESNSSSIQCMEDAVQRMTLQVSQMEFELAEADQREEALREELRSLSRGDKSTTSTQEGVAAGAPPAVVPRLNLQQINSE